MEQIKALYEKLKHVCPGLELLEGEPMARHTTFRVGGPVALMALPKRDSEAAAVVRTARELGITPFFLGNGSNLLVADEGYDGLVVKLAGEFNELREVDRQLESGAGVLLSRLANAALGRGLTGLEFAGGIPGSVGGAVTMNAGAYGGEMSQVITSVRVMDLTGNITELTNEACNFSYRRSVFEDGTRLILSARFALAQGDPEEIRTKMDDLAERRREKQPLEFPSAGSTFKRPPGHFAAALIDRCGLKGLTVGGAQVSEKHAGFVINKGGAACADILALMKEVQRRVYEQTGVQLEPEVKLLGE